jgi:hypothetical protein
MDKSVDISTFSQATTKKRSMLGVLWMLVFVVLVSMADSFSKIFFIRNPSFGVI